MNPGARWSEVLKAPAWVWTAALFPRMMLCLLAALDPDLAVRSDSYGYLELARNLLAHHGFFLVNGGAQAAEAFRTPGYPLFLAPIMALFSSPIPAAAMIQCLLGAVTAAAAWVWLDRAFGRAGAALGALWLALDPVTVFHTPLILTEPLFGVLLLAAVMLCWRALQEPDWRNAAASGLLWSASAFVRPISLYLPVLLVWIWRKEKKAAAVFLLAAYALPAGWILRNQRAVGYAVFSTVSARDTLRYPAAGVLSMKTGKPIGELEVALRERVERSRPEGFKNDTERFLAYQKAGIGILKMHPWRLVKYSLWGCVKILGGTGIELFLEWKPQGRPDTAGWTLQPTATGEGTLRLLRLHPLLIPVQLLYMGALASLYVMSAWGLWLLWRSGRRSEAIFLALCLAYFLGLSSTQPYYRYRIPMMPFLAAAAAAVLERRRSAPTKPPSTGSA